MSSLLQAVCELMGWHEAAELVPPLSDEDFWLPRLMGWCRQQADCFMVGQDLVTDLTVARWGWRIVGDDGEWWEPGTDAVALARCVLAMVEGRADD